MTELSGAYYAACNALFRSCTTQDELMLRESTALLKSKGPESVLSVGSGTGLFEIPLLRKLAAEGIGPTRFVGLDVSEEAAATLETELSRGFPTEDGYQAVCQSFQNFEPDETFDLLLFNHAFEYLGGNAATWLGKSRSLLNGSGTILIFSPDRGGINRIYEEEIELPSGTKPHFSDDIEAALLEIGSNYSKKQLLGSCDMSLLTNGTGAEPVMLLSFLTQTDCRTMPIHTRTRYADYYLSLRVDQTNSIPHPTTMIVV